MHWGCSLCVHLSKSAKDYLAHYKSHLENEKLRQPPSRDDISFSVMIQSLLTQDATNDKWNERSPRTHNLDRSTRLTWDIDDCADIREALEYGFFQGLSISEPDVVERLLDEVQFRPRRCVQRSPTLSTIKESFDRQAPEWLRQG
ncbi:hypothetical protein PV04_06357 [Phialophora macrospora]|uniref:C2H2-type domain-containing protein n=1 Tax=Phialophora macrospora TaxID=1851006 RepID=A0A0D2G4Z6_9EURO|nr:hypothetical protein PV04_06357 [Phialophora macrospora]